MNQARLGFLVMAALIAVPSFAHAQKKKKPAPKEREEVVEEDVAATSERGEKLKEGIDDLLDEIDSVLEDNAEEFVRSYVQKGGQ